MDKTFIGKNLKKFHPAYPKKKTTSCQQKAPKWDPVTCLSAPNATFMHPAVVECTLTTWQRCKGIDLQVSGALSVDVGTCR